MRETMAQIMESVGVPMEAIKSRKKLANNTIEYVVGNERRIRLHHTDILIFSPGRIKLNSGGWRTSTTRERIRNYLAGTEFFLEQENHRWFVRSHDGKEASMFYDGITIDTVNKKILKPKTEDRRTNDLEKLISRYCKKISTMEALPVPSGGDCWDCCLRTKEGQPMGDLSKSDHLISHLKEQYVHGSLILNALASKGYCDPAFVFQTSMKIGDRGQIVRSVRSYFRTKLGLVR
ncbi:MAG: hypothetical protein MUP55_03940 [Candidatus Aenigmarchaeota archaeon]|nr:hypothetical protein [Candidatus Aenigmarchaeota archaeon]